MPHRLFQKIPGGCAVLGCWILLTGCHSPPPPARAFHFPQDTFAFTNELFWTYQASATNGPRTRLETVPPPAYALHCFVMARSAKEFYAHARFDPAAPPVPVETYEKLIRTVVQRSARRVSPEEKKVVVPGYPDLRSFSAVWAPLFRERCGGAWQSYFQRGHWRMVFPFRRSYQERLARQLQKDPQPEVLHLVRFPQLTINHAVVVYGAEADDAEIRFAIYDPNEPQQPGTLTFQRSDRTFYLAPNLSFGGGRVDVYPVYRGWLY